MWYYRYYAQQFFCSNLALSFTFNGDDRTEIVHKNIDSFLMKQFDCVTVFSRNRMKGRKNKNQRKKLYVTINRTHSGQMECSLGKNGSFHFFQVFKTQRVCFVLPFYSNGIFLTMIIWLRLMCGQNINTPKKISLVYTKDGIYISTFTFYCYLLEKNERTILLPNHNLFQFCIVSSRDLTK